MQAVTATAERSRAGSAIRAHPIKSEELWEFCLHAIASDDVAAGHSGKQQPAAGRAKTAS